MEFVTYRNLVAKVNDGKHLPDALYLHASALKVIPEDLANYVISVSKNRQISRKRWNVVKLNKRDFKFSLLFYPDFDVRSYPELHTSYVVDIQRDTVKVIDYSKSDNPLILHRKETLVLKDYPHRETFERITNEGEAIGLYENVRRIGLKQNWLKLVADKGYYLDADGHLHPKVKAIAGAYSELEDAPIKVERHRTAINRQGLSAPMQILARQDYLEGSHSILDYGCGKGDDLRELETHGLDVEGWDPVYRPDGKREAKNSQSRLRSQCHRGSDRTRRNSENGLRLR